MPKTYAEAGVDQEDMNTTAKSIISGIKMFRRGMRNGLGAPYSMAGHFAGLVDFGDYALSLCTDGVGSKIQIAEAIGKYDTIGIDCIAMNVNDMICIGAEPMAFVDYLAMDKPNADIAHEIGKGLGRGAEMANIEIIGGETAILPEIVNGIDLSGTALGYVHKNDIITGHEISDGDVIISLASSGFHSNGYTLVRKVLEENNVGYDEPYGDRTVGKALLEPTHIYVREVLETVKEFRDYIHGMANITGGGVRNLNRLKAGMKFIIDKPSKRSRVFDYIQNLGGIEDYEMFQTFNMGMGFAIIASEDRADDIISFLRSRVEYEVAIVGHVEKSEGESTAVVEGVGEYRGY